MDRLACICSHPFDAHQHYRPGANCAHRNCTCPRYRERTPLSGWLLARIRSLLWW